VVLLGLRASGKSSLASILAARLGMPAVDLDDRTRILADRATVRDAFAALGEARFRELETHALRDALAEPPCVLALGGGTPTAPGATDLLQAARAAGHTLLVFLDPPLETLARRLSADAGDRPSLTGRGVVEEIAEIAARRRGHYAALADLVLREDLAPEALADRIEEALRRG
jgi:shikimate kinase